MDMLHTPIFWIELGAIAWINLLVSGDNAVMIALAARSLPERQQKLAVFWGSAAAVALRIALTAFAAALLELPWLKIAGGALLVWIGVKLLVPDQGKSDVPARTRLWHAVWTILVADLVMSLDNVLAVAAAANAAAPTPDLAAMKYTLMALGLAISIPIVIFGSVHDARHHGALPVRDRGRGDAARLDRGRDHRRGPRDRALDRRARRVAAPLARRLDRRGAAGDRAGEAPTPGASSQGRTSEGA